MVRVASRLAIPLVVFAACDGLRVISNGDEDGLYASIKSPNGAALLAPLPADGPSTLTISRWEQVTDDEGRNSSRAIWFEAGTPPVVKVSPEQVELSALDPTSDGRFLELTVTPRAPGRATLDVASDMVSDRWTLVFE